MASDNANRPAAELTKREFFAAIAMLGLCFDVDAFTNETALAQCSVNMADELLEQLETYTGHSKK